MADAAKSVKCRGTPRKHEVDIRRELDIMRTPTGASSKRETETERERNRERERERERETRAGKETTDIAPVPY